MLLQLVRARRRQVLIDINTQRDFLLASGSACIRNHRRVLAHIRRMMAWARTNDVSIISMCDAPVNGNGSPYHARNGGLQKVRYTLVNNHLRFSPDNNTDLPRDMLRQYKQVILPNRCHDPFDEPRIDRLLSEIRAGEFIVIGTSVEGAVAATVLGLLQRHKAVTVVTDAVGGHDSHNAKMALRKMEAKGATMIETKRLAGTSHLRLVGVCDCDSCRRLLAKTAQTSSDSTPPPH